MVNSKQVIPSGLALCWILNNFLNRLKSFQFAAMQMQLIPEFGCHCSIHLIQTRKLQTDLKLRNIFCANLLSTVYKSISTSPVFLAKLRITEKILNLPRKKFSWNYIAIITNVAVVPNCPNICPLTSLWPFQPQIWPQSMFWKHKNQTICWLCDAESDEDSLNYMCLK